MMLYQQNMIDTTIQPIASTLRTKSSSGSTEQQQARQPRSVVFCASTKPSPPQEQPRSLKRRSSSVPIPDALRRSPSELQLSVDEQVADERDFVFYARLVSGIRERSNPHGMLHRGNAETERCLTHIMQTRYNQDPQQQVETDGVPILREEDNCTGGYYLEDIDGLTSSSSSYSSSSTYQQDFEPNHHNAMNNHHGEEYGESDGIFDLEL